LQHGEELNRGELAGTRVTTTSHRSGGRRSKGGGEGGGADLEEEEGERGLESKTVPTYLVEAMPSSSSLDA